MIKRKMKKELLAILAVSLSLSACGEPITNPVLYDTPELLSSKEAIISAFGDEGECLEEPFKKNIGLRCSYPIEKIDVFYVAGEPKSFTISEGGFAGFRRLEQSALALLGITNVSKGVIENENKFGIRWSSKSLNLEVSLFGDGSGALTHGHVTKLKY